MWAAAAGGVSLSISSLPHGALLQRIRNGPTSIRTAPREELGWGFPLTAQVRIEADRSAGGRLLLYSDLPTTKYTRGEDAPTVTGNTRRALHQHPTVHDRHEVFDVQRMRENFVKLGVLSLCDLVLLLRQGTSPGLTHAVFKQFSQPN
jgi:hypothetical protein